MTLTGEPFSMCVPPDSRPASRARPGRDRGKRGQGGSGPVRVAVKGCRACSMPADSRSSSGPRPPGCRRRSGRTAARAAGGPCGSGSVSAYSMGSVRTPSRRSVPCVLPSSMAGEAMSMMSSEIWNAEPQVSPNVLSARIWSGRDAGEHAAEPAARGDQRARLLVDDRQVVRHGVLARGRADRLPHLARDQLAEGGRHDVARLRAQVGHQPRGVREEEVAGEDGDRVVPAGVAR